MPVPSLPISYSDIVAEFGSKSGLTAYFTDGSGGVGGLPGNMTEFAGLSDFTTISGATLTADLDSASCNSAGSCNPGGSSCTLSPVVTDGDPSTRTYLWTKNSGTTPDNGTWQTDSSIGYNIPGQSLSDGQSVSKSGNFTVKVTDSTGNVTSNSANMSATIQNDGAS